MQNISFNEAVDKILNLDIKPLESERVFLHDAINRVLSSDICAKLDSPKCDTSNMDGYAFKTKDLEYFKKNGLEIQAINKAGNLDLCELKPKSCIKTFTGSKIPKNADSLVIVEQVSVKNNRILLNENETIKNHIRKQGENFKKDDVLLEKNHLISPLDIGILAQNNEVFLKVRRKPKIAIWTSGDELIEIGQTAQNDNSIYSSNNHILKSISQSLGAEASLCGILKDKKSEIKNNIKDSLKNSDIVVTTGGMSKGDFDFIKDLIADFGENIFYGINIKPGKVSALVKCAKSFGENKYILSLPGNPSSSVVAFLLFGRLILQKMLGLKPEIPRFKAKLAHDLINNESRLVFQMCDLNIKNGFFEVSARQNTQSYMINNFYGALAVIDKKQIKKGEFVDIIALDNLLKL